MNVRLVRSSAAFVRPCSTRSSDGRRIETLGRGLLTIRRRARPPGRLRARNDASAQVRRGRRRRTVPANVGARRKSPWIASDSESSEPATSPRSMSRDTSRTIAATSSRCATRGARRPPAWPQLWGVPKVYDSLDAILADDEIDAVEILTPTFMHKDHVIAAARAGKHISVQKPIANSVADAREMIAAVEAAGVVFRVTENAVHYPPLVKARELIAAGAIGTPQHGPHQDRRRPLRQRVPGQPRTRGLHVALRRAQPRRPPLRRHRAQVRRGAVARSRKRCAACRRSCGADRSSSRRPPRRSGNTTATTCSA